jgi:formylglycine-generating enzyme required for sulfatase activity
MMRTDDLFSFGYLPRSKGMRLFFTRVALALMVAGTAYAPSQAGTVTFGSGGNQFNMDFVTIGNASNAADTTGAPNPAGAVGYEYGIGKFEVSEDMIAKFNASQSLQITQDTRGTAKPATSVSWNEAARFVNWLNTSTGGFAAYNFTTGGVNDDIALWTAADTLDYEATNPYRSKRATYVLPSFNEWYKAAYYNPTNSTYYDYANGSDTPPGAVASGTADNTAVYDQSFGQGPADVDQAGGLSPYGVMGLGGNVQEWEESSEDLANSSVSASRGSRGGIWYNDSSDLSSSSRASSLDPSIEFFGMGFRVASLPSSAAAVPEPSMMVIGTLFGLGGLMAKRRMKK